MFSNIIAIVVVVVVIALVLVYCYCEWKFSYWRRFMVPTIKPSFPFGNMEGFKRTKHSAVLLGEFYHRFKRNDGRTPFGGLYLFMQPFAVIVDLDLVKNILIKDFNTFPDRGAFYNEKDDPLSANLFSLDGEKWKQLRSKLTPTFTSGKMKFMFPTIVEKAEMFQAILRDIVTTDSDLNVKDILARFSTDVIGTCAFGIDCNSLKDPDAEFRQMGKKVFDNPRNMAVKQMFMTTFRRLALKLRMKSHHKDVTEFFMKIVKETVEYRERNNVHRNDFMDLLIKLKNSEDSALTMEEIAAQAFVFFLAGFETSSTTMAYCLYELAYDQDIQARARKSITDTLAKHNGDLSYTCLMEMTYVDQIINEALRKYPPGANVIRKARRDYVVPNTNLVIENGTTVWIPVYGIHHDPELYPAPETFDPERFSPSRAERRHPQAFLPFGDGPRNCIALRFGMMQTRIGLVTLLRNFRFDICSRTTVPLTFSTTNVMLTPKDGLWLNITAL